MSRHQAYRNYDYENDLDEYAGDDYSDEEEELVRKAGDEIATFVKRRWNEDEWETAWFVNPPVSVLIGPRGSWDLSKCESR